MPRRPPGRPDPDSLSDRNREALAALRRLWAQPPARTDEEREKWIREIRLMGEASDRRMVEQIEPATESPIAAPPDEDPAPESPRLPHRSESSDITAGNTLRNESAAPRPPVRPDPDSLSDRNREALEALRSLWARPPARTDEERENWIREIRLMREASTRHRLEKIARALEEPASEDSAPSPPDDP